MPLARFRAQRAWKIDGLSFTRANVSLFIRHVKAKMLSASGSFLDPAGGTAPDLHYRFAMTTPIEVLDPPVSE